MADSKFNYAPLPYGLTQGAGLKMPTWPTRPSAPVATTSPLSEMDSIAQSFMPTPYQPEQAGTQKAAVAYSPSQKKFFVSGYTFDEDNDTAAAESMKVFNPANPMDLPPGDWRPLTSEGYTNYVRSITDPSMKRLAAKNFGIGVDNMQALAGYGLQFAGAERAGKAIVKQQEEDLSKSMVYQRSATEIGSDPNRGITDWFVANLAQQGPNIVESAVTAVLGGIAGGAAGAASGPGAAVTAAGGAIAGLVGKSAFKAGLLAAAKKYAEGKALTYAEKKLLVEAASLTAAAQKTALEAGASAAFKQAGRIGGAGLATFANNQAMGIADVYGETVDLGNPDRGYAAVTSIPYALLETAPEFLLAGRLFGDLVHGGKGLAGRTFMGKAGEILRRGGVGGTVGALSEGSVEGAQEALLMAANPAIDWDSPDSVARLFNSFAAGAGVGGAIGSLANLRGRGQEANLLQPTAPLALPAPAPTPGLPFGGGSAIPGSAIPMPGMTTSGTVVAGLQQPINIQQPAEGSPTVSMAGTATGTLPTGQMTPTSVEGQGLLSLGPSAGPTPNIAQNPYQNSQPVPGAATGQPAPAAPVAPPVPPSVGNMMQQAQAVLQPANPLTMGGQTTGQFIPVRNAAVQEQMMPAGITADDIANALAAPAETGALTLPPLSKGDQLKRGKATTQNLLSRDYGALADNLKAQPERAALAEKLATMSDANLRKLSKVWDSKFEPDVAADPAAVTALIDRTVGGNKPLKVAKPAAIVPKETADVPAPVPSEPVAAAPEAAPAPKPIGAPVPAGAAGAALKKGTPKKAPVVLRKDIPTPKVEPKLVLPDKLKGSTPKNVDGVASPPKKADAEPKAASEEDELKSAVDTWDDPKDTVERTSAAQYLLNVAFFGDSNDSTYGRTKAARSAIDKMLQDADTDGGDTGVALDNAIVTEARSINDAEKRSGKGERTSLSEGQKAFKDLIAKRGLTSRIKVATPESDTLAAVGDIEEMTAIIQDMLTKKGEMQDTAYRARKMNEAKVVYNRLRKEGKDPFIFGVKVSQLFKNNRLDIQLDSETNTYRLAVGFDVAKDIIKPADAPKGMFSRIDGRPITKTFAPAEVTMMVKSMLTKFAKKPAVSVFRNVADLKAKNAALFKRAAAARAQGDFESTPAAGYSFSDQVIIFSDHVRTEQHLATLLAHEAIGHFGLRSLMSQADLNTLLDEVYNSDSRLKSEIDQMAGDRRENTEEYLATYAATLETSIIAKVWNAIKNILNKLGVQFDDDLARQIISQARKYVRSTEGSFFSAGSLYDTIQGMAADHSEGRFSASPLDDKALSGKFMGAQAMNRFTGQYGGLFGAAQFLKDNGIAKAMGTTAGGAREVYAKIVTAVETLDNKAARSAGLTQVFKLFERQHNLSRQLLSKYNSMTSFTHRANWIVAKKDAPNELDKEDAGELLAFATLERMSKVTTELYDSYSDLITVDKYGNAIENTAVIEAMKKAGFVTAEEFRKGLKWKDALGNEQEYPARKIDENSKAWKIYVEQREAVAAAAIDVLRSHYDSLTQLNRIVVSNLGSIEGTNGKKFTADDLNTLRDISKEFYTLYLKNMKVSGSQVALDKDNAKKATDFIYETTRVMFEDKKLQDWLKNTPTEAASQFQGPEYKHIVDRLTALSKVRLSERDLGRVQQALQNAALSKVDAINSEYYAKRTILGSYVPLKRDGKLQVKLRAYDKAGKPVVLSEEFQGVMPYFREDDLRAAEAVRDNLDKLFGGEYNVKDAAGSEVKVKFKAEYSKARLTPDLGDVTDYNSFIYVLNRQNISITPQERQRLVEGLTRQGSMARSNLQRTGNPGWRRAMIRNVSEFLETSAHAAAKRTYRTQMDDVLDRPDMWLGSKEKLAALKAAYEVKGLSDSKRAYLKREYDTYARQFVESWSVDGTTVEINGKKVPTRGQGEAYHEDAKKLLRWQADNLNIIDSTEDILSTDWGAKLKTGTVLMQLGMSVATAVVNIGSLATHSLTYMSFYNSKNGFGMGFGMADSAMALSRALADLKSYKFDDHEFVKELLDKKKFGDYGLTRDEAEYLYEQTANGTLQAAAFDALIGSARGKVQSNRISDVIQKWMFMFSYTEQLNRRVTALAAYRLEKARGMAEGGLSEKEAMKKAGSAAHEAVNTSQGLYSMFNRPELARGNIGQYFFMYKMFTAITVQMMRNLPPAGRVTFLAMMLVASGVKGVPFAEDIMDLIDTLAQMFGIKMPSVEKEAYQFFDSIAPGYAPYFMRGALDQLTGSTVSSKMGMGDIIPLSGSLKYGADPWNEAKQFAGPVFGATMGLGSWSQLIGRYGAEVVGLQPDATTGTDVLRNAPLAVLRSIGDSMAYANTGNITNIRGQVVSRDVGYSTVVMRALGFYPAESTRQNDTIRLIKMQGEYAKAIKSKMVNAYTQAGVRKDTAAMKHIADQVREWNIDAKGTGLEIKDFQNSANTSLKEAQRESVIRFRRTAPKHLKPQLDELMRLQGINPND